MAQVCYHGPSSFTAADLEFPLLHIDSIFFKCQKLNIMLMEAKKHVAPTVLFTFCALFLSYIYSLEWPIGTACALDSSERRYARLLFLWSVSNAGTKTVQAPPCVKQYMVYFSPVKPIKSQYCGALRWRWKTSLYHHWRSDVMRLRKLIFSFSTVKFDQSVLLQVVLTNGLLIFLLQSSANSDSQWC